MSHPHAIFDADQRHFPICAVSVAVFIFVIMTLVPRLVATLVPVIFLFVVVTTTRWPAVKVPTFVPASMALALAALFGWIMVRGPSPGSGLEAVGNLIVLAAYVLLSIAALDSADRVQPVHSQIECGGLAIGLLIAAILVFVHLATNQSVARDLHNWFPVLRSDGARNTIVDGRVVALNDSEVNRQAILLALWMWPVWLMARTWQKPWARWLSSGLLIAVAGAVAFGTSETAKLALITGGLLFAIYRWRPRLALAAAIVGWTSAVFLVIPLSIGMHDAGMHKSDRLFYTARARVVVWSSVAKKILDRPFVGHGLLAMRSRYHEPENAKLKQTDVETELPLEAPHAHNVYLQVWYEFGGIGALLFGLVGYAALSTVWRLPEQLRAVGIAHFGVISGVLATGYGLWQPWLQAAIAYSLFLLLRARTREPVDHTNLTTRN